MILPKPGGRVVSSGWEPEPQIRIFPVQIRTLTHWSCNHKHAYLEVSPTGQSGISPKLLSSLLLTCAGCRAGQSTYLFYYRLRLGLPAYHSTTVWTNLIAHCIVTLRWKLCLSVMLKVNYHYVRKSFHKGKLSWIQVRTSYISKRPSDWQNRALQWLKIQINFFNIMQLLLQGESSKMCKTSPYLKEPKL